MDFLMRDQSPLTEADWSEMEQAVIQVAKRIVVGRRFLPLYGPVGPGNEVIPVNRFEGVDFGQIGMTGADDDPVTVSDRIYLQMPLLHKDFVLYWRDLEQSRRYGTVQDWSTAQAAAAFVAQAEDHLIFHGAGDYHISGLLTVSGRHVLPASDWQTVGAGFNDVVEAIAHLTSAGFFPPYAAVVGPTAYAMWHRLYGESGVLEIEQIQKLVQKGVYVSPLIPDQTVLVVSVGSENVDLGVGLDLSVAFLETSQMNHHFRVLEIIAPRIKRPGSLAVVEPLAGI